MPENVRFREHHPHNIQIKPFMHSDSLNLGPQMRSKASPNLNPSSRKRLSLRDESNYNPQQCRSKLSHRESNLSRHSLAAPSSQDAREREPRSDSI